MAKYLDETGVARLWTKIKAYVADNATAPTNITGNAGTATKLQYARAIDGVTFDGAAARHHHGTCSTAAGTTTKIVSITGFSLVTGAKITVLFNNAITCQNATLNVSGTGAKAIYYNGTQLPANYIKAKSLIELVYTGSWWRIVGNLTADSQKINAKILWRGALMAGGYTEFNVPEECFHNNGTTLTLQVDGYYRNEIGVYGKNFGISGVTLCVGSASDFGLTGRDDRIYGPYKDGEGNALAILYRNDSIAASGTIAQTNAYVRCRKVPDTRYAVCNITVDYASNNNSTLTCISAISPVEMEV